MKKTIILTTTAALLLLAASCSQPTSLKFETIEVEEFVLGEKYASLTPEKAVNACIEEWKKGYSADTEEYPLIYEYICTDTILSVNDSLPMIYETKIFFDYII